jgi:hypothetical protein
MLTEVAGLEPLTFNEPKMIIRKTKYQLTTAPAIFVSGDALTHRREVCFFTPKNKIAKKQIALSAMLNLGLFLPYN